MTITAEGEAVTINNTAVTAQGDEGKIDVTGMKNVKVTGASKLEADKAVTVKSTGTGYVLIDTTNSSVTAKDGAVTITAEGEAVTVNNTVVTAQGDDGAIDVTAKKNVKVTGAAKLLADKAVTVESTDSNITIETTDTENATVAAKDGAVTLSAEKGAVTIYTATVTAAGENGKIGIVAGTGVEINNGAKLDAAKNIEISTKAGNVTAAEGTSLTAGDNLIVSAVNTTEELDGNIGISGKVTVAGTTDLEAKGTIIADNRENDFKGTVDATAQKGSVELVDANTILLNDIDAGTTVDVKAQDIEVVANITEGTGVDAVNAITLTAKKTILLNNQVTSSTSGDITLDAGDSITVNSAVRSNAEGENTGDIKGTAQTGDITFGANGSMWANGGSVSLDAAKNITSENTATAITAKDTISLKAGEEIGSPMNVSSPNLKVLSGGASNIVMKRGAFNENGDLAVDDVNSSIETGKDLNLVVEGNLSTPNGGIIRVGNNLDLAVNSATPEVNLTLGGSTIRATNKTQDAVAFKLHGGTQYPTVIGTQSNTGVFIDGRIAGGDSAFFSILQSYEGLAALGMTPSILGAKMDEAPAIFRDKNQNLLDVLPNTWDAQLDDNAVVPEEAKDSDATSKIARR